MAGAVISVDLADFDAGTIVEGQTPLIKHVYKIKNKGDSVLQVKSVKAG
jgi:hypothetical protein